MFDPARYGSACNVTWPSIKNRLAFRSRPNTIKGLGRFGEHLAKHLLESKRYTIWHTNWRCPIGEIDIVASNMRELVFVEVKTRSKSDISQFDPIKAVDEHKRRKLAALRRWYIRQMSRRIKRAGIRKFRFDIIGITYLKSSPKQTPEIEHLEDVFLNL